MPANHDRPLTLLADLLPVRRKILPCPVIAQPYLVREYSCLTIFDLKLPSAVRVSRLLTSQAGLGRPLTPTS